MELLIDGQALTVQIAFKVAELHLDSMLDSGSDDRIKNALDYCIWLWLEYGL